MKLEALGYNETHEKFRIENKLDAFEVARVVAEHKERYVVRTEAGEYDAEVTGNLRFSARSREDFPAVGDWVALIRADADFGIIHSVFPRSTVLSRQAVGKPGERQVIAANIDCALVVQAADRDFNINRLERYLTISYEAKAEPAIVLTKTDLIGPERLHEILEQIKRRIEGVQVFPISNATEEGLGAVRTFIRKGRTYCLLGSSGVGKSTLMNILSGRTVMETGSISTSTNKGRHVTSHRELTILDGGGILIDNPGMREIGIADATGGLETTFDRIISYSGQCKFSDCTHTSETGCAVIEAVERGDIDMATYQNYLKMEREKAHFDLTVSEKRKKEKEFGKMMKNFKNDIQKVSAKHNKPK
jgi:ribosome biogenesis GTPase